MWQYTQSQLSTCPLYEASHISLQHINSASRIFLHSITHDHERTDSTEKTSKPREFYGNYRRKIIRQINSKISSMEEEEEEYRNRAASTLHGSISVIGRRRMMEDAVKIVPGFVGSYDFFAVYDGHGGATVANACRERMHLLVAEQVIIKEAAAGADHQNRSGLMLDWREAMCSSFMRMDREVRDDTVGSTALVVVVGSDQLVVANCGDSRAVLCRGGVAVPLSTDHKVIIIIAITISN